MPYVYAHVLYMKLRTHRSPQIHTQRVICHLYVQCTEMYETVDLRVLRFLYEGMFNLNAYCRFSLPFTAPVHYHIYRQSSLLCHHVCLCVLPIMM